MIEKITGDIDRDLSTHLKKEAEKRQRKQETIDKNLIRDSLSSPAKHPDLINAFKQYEKFSSENMKSPRIGGARYHCVLCEDSKLVRGYLLCKQHRRMYREIRDELATE